MLTSDTDQVLIKRLQDYLGNSFDWGTGAITLEDIADAQRKGVSPIEDQYEVPSLLESEDKLKSKDWHIGRILYFVEKPSAIDPILLDNQCYNGMITALPLIDDGHHRYLAAVFLKQEKLPVHYCGRVDLLDYLSGKSNKIPV